MAGNVQGLAMVWNLEIVSPNKELKAENEVQQSDAAEVPTSSQTITKPNVVRSVSEIEERMNFNNQEIEKWRTELHKELKDDRGFRDEGYVSHCRELITDLKSDNSCLRWILGIV
jgi:uncharacterized small protein (DUF1192 family)